jgi:nitrate/TMAO reductase-like tetraheme cytochrome c subunit
MSCGAFYKLSSLGDCHIFQVLIAKVIAKVTQVEVVATQFSTGRIENAWGE